jgi:hypothetical protein
LYLAQSLATRDGGAPSTKVTRILLSHWLQTTVLKFCREPDRPGKQRVKKDWLYTMKVEFVEKSLKTGKYCGF